MSDLIQRRVLLRIIRSLSAADKEELKIILKQKSPSAVYHFLISKNPDIEKITDEEVIKFKEEILRYAENLNL